MSLVGLVGQRFLPRGGFVATSLLGECRTPAALLVVVQVCKGGLTLLALQSHASKPGKEALVAKPQGDDSRGLLASGLLAGASGSSLLAGASGLLIEELLAAGGLLAGASGLLVKELLAADGLLAGASGVLVEELLAAGGLLSRRSNRVGHDGLEVGHDSGHRIVVGEGGQMSRR